MTDETKENIGFIVCMIFVATSAASMTHLGTDWSWRRQIAGHHAAEFYLDSNSYRQWRWKDCQSSPDSVPNDSTTVNP